MFLAPLPVLHFACVSAGTGCSPNDLNAMQGDHRAAEQVRAPCDGGAGGIADLTRRACSVSLLLARSRAPLTALRKTAVGIFRGAPSQARIIIWSRTFNMNGTGYNQIRPPSRFPARAEESSERASLAMSHLLSVNYHTVHTLFIRPHGVFYAGMTATDRRVSRPTRPVSATAAD